MACFDTTNILTQQRKAMVSLILVRISNSLRYADSNYAKFPEFNKYSKTDSNCLVGCVCGGRVGTDPIATLGIETFYRDAAIECK